jgi:hypothetical protein
MSEVKFTIDDHEYFIRMTPRDIAEGKKVHNRAFREALEGKSLLRKSLMNHMREQGVWDDQKEEKYQAFIRQIGELEFKLSSGKMKISEGRELAIQLSKVRNEFRELIAERNMMDSNTAEGQSDNVRFNFLITKCVYDYVTQKPVFKDVDDYMDRGDDKLSIDLASKFANFLYGVDEDYDKGLVENKFLRRFNLIDDKGRFTNKDGKLVDIEGKPVDEEGYRLDENGVRIDINGHHLDVNVETAEFIED